MKLDDLTVREMLASIGDRTAVPGGGAVASVVAGLAAALAQMVVAFSRGKRSLAAHESLHGEALTTLETLRARALDLAQADASAFTALSALWKLPEDDERRRREWDDAVLAAIDAPQRVVDTCLELLRLLEGLRGTTNPSLDSDLAIAAALAVAGARSAAWNIRINLPQVADPACASALAAGIETDLAEADRLASRVEEHCAAAL